MRDWGHTGCWTWAAGAHGSGSPVAVAVAVKESNLRVEVVS